MAGARKRGRERASQYQPLVENKILFHNFHRHFYVHTADSNLLLSSGDVMITLPSPKLINYSGLLTSSRWQEKQAGHRI